MKAIIPALLALAFTAAPVIQAQAQNIPCSGKMGGIDHCSKDGKFVCKNGKISKSKKICR
ncbi:hypothetical protein [Psychrobacter sp. CAL346-MNA-CIBAN-0220]|uniref:hypothetical protein n=1 Tax=Psychrobacter sp. CAL346-MNA-CIBAN-0220 TaxID=3140457 RepID=UPI003325E7DB